MTSTPRETEIQQVPHSPPSLKADREAEIHEPTSSATVTEESQPIDHPPASDEETKKWGTHVMGPPSEPNVHPDNQQAALWNASGQQQISEYPYLVYTPKEKSDKSTQKSFEPVINKFQEWGKSADTVARNIWHNLKTGPSVPQAAWGKVNLTAKAITEGGFESLFKHIFETDANEKLKKTFACYLSTSTGPVAGTLYLSTARVAFCSDRPLCHTAPSGEEAWSYYKVMIPLEKISTVNSEIMIENPSKKFIQIVTTDEHDFWFMGFVNFEKALQNLSESVSSFKEAGSPVQPVVA
ncbi:GEM protein [Salix suchowensis]|nr:GEM protein [Salix suchowensis]